MTRKRYPSDLTNAQWAKIADEIPPAKLGGRPRTTDMREVVNAILYIARSGAPWEMLRMIFLLRRLCITTFGDGLRMELWKVSMTNWCPKVRQKSGKDPNPSVAIIDSQSVKPTEKGGSGL